MPVRREPASVDVGERLQHLETGYTEIRDSIGSLRNAIDRLAGQVAERQRAPWQLLIAGFSIIVALVVGASGLLAFIGRASLAPLEQRLAAIQAQADEQGGRLDRVQLNSGGLSEIVREVDTRQGEKFAEVETQFLSLSNQTNMRQSEHDRLLRLLWRRAYSEELPGNGIWPVVGKQ